VDVREDNIKTDITEVRCEGIGWTDLAKSPTAGVSEHGDEYFMKSTKYIYIYQLLNKILRSSVIITL